MSNIYSACDINPSHLGLNRVSNPKRGLLVAPNAYAVTKLYYCVCTHVGFIFLVLDILLNFVIEIDPCLTRLMGLEENGGYIEIGRLLVQ